MGGLSRGLPSFEVQATSGAWVGLYLPVRVRWRMDSKNSARSATLDPLLPQLAERSLRQGREVAGVGPSTHRTRELPRGAVAEERLLGHAAHLSGDRKSVVEGKRVDLGGR